VLVIDRQFSATSVRIGKLWLLLFKEVLPSVSVTVILKCMGIPQMGVERGGFLTWPNSIRHKRSFKTA
jgi:hypothetical protein